MKVRRGKPEDIETIRKLGKEFYDGTLYSQMGIKYSPTTIYTLLTTLMGDHGIVCVAEEENEIIGFILLALFPFPFNAKYVGATELAFYVTPEAQSKGAGKLLLGKAEQVAKQLGVNLLSMVSLETGTPESAQAVYNKLGYTKNEVVFTKDL